MGVVYEALDREASRRVALKTLLRGDPTSLYRLKQEFRALADVHHPNLVRLYELVQPPEGPLFLTMELVVGTDFVDYVQRGRLSLTGKPPSTSRSSDDSRTVTREVTVQSLERLSQLSPVPVGDEPSPADPERLRPALRQLVRGLQALHAAGKLHRDVKPSNVLVTAEGRVVLVDFGIAFELSRGPDESEQVIVGTPKYVSPEQVLGQTPSPASDWYSVGVLLYEALTGRRPFEGKAMDVMTRKTYEGPPPPSAWVRGVPADLEALCVDLLRREPAERPTGAEILRRLGVTRSQHPEAAPRAAAHPHGQALIGRETPLAQLQKAFDEVAGGHPLTVRVGGAAGMGKSALVQSFIDHLATDGEGEALCGRAYERESVPYKAVDALVDALAYRLVQLEEAEACPEPPKHAYALVRLFPVLSRVPRLAAVPEQDVSAPRRVREQAFGALRDILRSLTRRRPLVVYLDDVQWGDADSLALLCEVMRPPRAPAILLVMTYREEEAAASPFLVEMIERWPLGAEVREIQVGALSSTDARRLALARLGASDGLAAQAADIIARESGGSPFLIEELAGSYLALARTATATFAIPTLAEIVSARLAALPERVRRLAEVVAVAGRPVARALLAGACGEALLQEEEVELLRSERLVRPGLRDGREVVEPSHDRIRETIVAQLPPDLLREHHGRLARAFEAASASDVEAIAVHLLGSGETERALTFVERAAEQAHAKLAFDQEARLYRLALATLPRTAEKAHSIRVRLANALEHAGRGAEAAPLYLEATENAPPVERLALERSAADQLLASGHTDAGVEVLRRVLDAVGMKAPRSALGAIVSLLVYRLMLRIRGLRYEERGPEDVRPEDRLRVDALRTVAVGFSVVDVLLGACMQARFFRLALDVGDRLQVLLAASVQITHLASQGGRVREPERAAYALAERLSQRIQTPDAHAIFTVCRGLALFHRGHWREAHRILRRTPPETTMDAALSFRRLFLVYSCFYLGRLREQARRASRLLADAGVRGDLYTAVNLRAAPLVDTSLAADDPEAGREHLRVALASWTQNGFHIQHWKAMVWGAQIELYVGDGEAAYARLERDWRAYRRSLLDHSQFVRELTRFWRACAAIADASGAPPRRRRARLAEARSLARRLERAGMSWTAPLASMTLASVANAEGDAAAAEAALRAVLEQAAAADMTMYAEAARHQLGCLLGPRGAAVREEAETAMRAEGIQAPARWATMLLPGRWGAQELAPP